MVAGLQPNRLEGRICGNELTKMQHDGIERVLSAK